MNTDGGMKKVIGEVSAAIAEKKPYRMNKADRSLSEQQERQAAEKIVESIFRSGSESNLSSSNQEEVAKEMRLIAAGIRGDDYVRETLLKSVESLNN